ncbi:MAG TPA: outer membrane beta-barrel protein, partial [Rhizomicrobium sp.]
YSLPSLGSVYLKSDRASNDLYGFVPQAFIKIAPADDFSIEIGKLPTLIGSEYTFTFENMNIERGLLWNQEPAVSQGIQGNYTAGPFSLALSWNDGFYSDRFNWVSASLAYAVDAQDTFTLVGGGNLGRTAHADTATPLLQNNGQIYDLIYAHTSGSWTVSPYFQYSHIPANAALGIERGASTYAAAILADYALTQNWRVGGRVEYTQATGSPSNGAPNVLYGAGSRAWSLTITPTYQNGIFFARAEASYVGIGDATPGTAFGPNLDKTAQMRLLLEAGVLF